MQSSDVTAPADFDAAWDDTRIGRYVFRRVVGSGGMGVVVAAHDPELDREVAIKLVASGAEADDGRAQREAQAMARLSHPNVVQVYEMIRLGERTAIVMQLVDGEDLGAWYAREKPSWREVLAVYSQAGRGLAAAHRAGIVHRDFKPSNALIDRDGVIRVTDFGLARRATDAVTAGAGTTISTTGIAGTPAYMAPEQWRGEPGVACDVYSLGCTLFELITGDVPFAGSLPELMISHADARPARLSWLRSGVSPTLERLVLRMLAKEPALRPTMRCVAEELEQLAAVELPLRMAG